MGNITDQEQHERDVLVLNRVAVVVPEFKRHLSHHLRNPLSGIMGSVELAQRDLQERNFVAIENHLARIMAACDHIRDDIEEVGL